MTATIVETCAITGGAGTHAGVHVAAALDPVGGLPGVQEFPASPAGYALYRFKTNCTASDLGFHKLSYAGW
jgi:hypothetical protein